MKTVITTRIQNCYATKQVYWNSFLKGEPREDSQGGEQLQRPIAPKTNLLRDAEVTGHPRIT
eukprot:8353259-Ditylum_brightwellii.AAC.1